MACFSCHRQQYSYMPSPTVRHILTLRGRQFNPPLYWSELVLHNHMSHCVTMWMTVHFNLRVSFGYSFLENGLSLGQTEAVISQKEYRDIHTRPILSVVSMLACWLIWAPRASGSVSSFWCSCSCKMWIAVQTLPKPHQCAPGVMWRTEETTMMYHERSVQWPFLTMEQFISCWRFCHRSVMTHTDAVCVDL